jgi:hypothetical protein
MSCPRMVGCPMFPVFTLKSSLRVWQTRYCEGAFDDCMRFRLHSAGTCAPPNLLPNGKQLQTATRPDASKG